MARDRAWKVSTRMSELTRHQLCAGRTRATTTNTILPVRDAAREEFVDWRDNLERRLRNHELSPALEGHFAKYRKLVPALALINHLADGGKGAVGQPALHKAIAFSVYLESHARRIYGAADVIEVTAAKAILAHIRQGELKDGFTARDVHRHGWSKLTEHGGCKPGSVCSSISITWRRTEVTVMCGRQSPKVTYADRPENTELRFCQFWRLWPMG